MSSKQEFPPLLPPGFHPMTLEQLYQFAVAHPRFKLSQRREMIIAGLRVAIAQLCRWAIHGELWIDGSFLTEKIDPDDVDFVAAIDEEVYASLGAEQRAIIDWFFEDKSHQVKALLHCDSYAFAVLDVSHPAHGVAVYWDSYWKEQFGISRGKEPKGIVVIHVPGGCV